MSVTIEQLMQAIKGQESGGQSDPYRVVNAYGAVGAYQVLKANIPSWTRAALGKSLTWRQFRDSKEAQDKTVYHRLKGYHDKHGDRGAAAAWYSGDPTLHMSMAPQPGGPPIKVYVDQVLARAAKFPGDGGLPRGGTGLGSRGDAETNAGIIDSLASIGGNLKDAAAGLAQVGAVARMLTKLALPSTWVRIIAGILGIALLFIGIFVLGREARTTSREDPSSG